MDGEQAGRQAGGRLIGLSPGYLYLRHPSFFDLTRESSAEHGDAGEDDDPEVSEREEGGAGGESEEGRGESGGESTGEALRERERLGLD